MLSIAYLCNAVDSKYLNHYLRKNNFPDVEFAVDHRRKAVTIYFEGLSKGDE